MKEIIAFLILTISLQGCARPFQPAPQDFQRWFKPGASVEQIKKSMLECGFSNYFNNGKMTDNDYARAQNCMVKNGYKSDYEGGIFCDRPMYKNLPTCQEKN